MNRKLTSLLLSIPFVACATVKPEVFQSAYFERDSKVVYVTLTKDNKDVCLYSLGNDNYCPSWVEEKLPMTASEEVCFKNGENMCVSYLDVESLTEGALKGEGDKNE